MITTQKPAPAFLYHPVLAKMMRSDAVPALLLSYVYEYAKTLPDPTVEIVLTKRYLAAETGISRYKVERARKVLVLFTIHHRGQKEWVWRESLRTIGNLRKTRYLHVTINVAAIDFLLGKYYTK